MSLRLEEDDGQPVNVGSIPTIGTYTMIINFGKYAINFPKDQKHFPEFWWDGDVKRPILIAQDIDASRIKKLLRKFGDKALVVTITSEHNRIMYIKAEAKYCLRMMYAWVESYIERGKIRIGVA